MKVKVRNKVIPVRFLKIEERGTLVGGERPERERQLEELIEPEPRC